MPPTAAETMTPSIWNKNNKEGSTSGSDVGVVTVALTGATGFLGQHILRALLMILKDNDTNDDWTNRWYSSEFFGTGNEERTATQPPSPNISLHVYALHQSSEKQSELEAAITANSVPSSLRSTVVQAVALDLTCKEACHEWISSLSSSSSSPSSLDLCIHTAALSSPAQCEAHPDQAKAVNVPTHFFDALFQHNPKIHILALSTDQVYDGEQPKNMTQAPPSPSLPSLYTEDSPALPINVYGQSKLDMEEYLMDKKSRGYPNSTVWLLRSSIILGPLVPFIPAHDTFLHFCHWRGTPNTTSNNEDENGNINTTVYFTNEIRSVIAVSDVIAVILSFLVYTIRALIPPCATSIVSLPPSSGVYNMGGPTAVSRYDMALAVLDHFQWPSESAVPALKEEPTNGGGCVPPSPLNIGMDSTKLMQRLLLGTTRFQTLPEIVASTLKSYAS